VEGGLKNVGARIDYVAVEANAQKILQLVRAAAGGRRSRGNEQRDVQERAVVALRSELRRVGMTLIGHQERVGGGKKRRIYQLQRLPKRGIEEPAQT
jgi:hypothetical protein